MKKIIKQIIQDLGIIIMAIGVVAIGVMLGLMLYDCMCMLGW